MKTFYVNVRRGLWRLAIGALGVFWLVVLGAFATGDLPGFALADVLLRMTGLSACYLAGCKVVDWIAPGFAPAR